MENRVAPFQNIMKREGIDAWIVGGSDPHSSEYVADRWNTREYLSLFSGSAGTIVLLQDNALLWADSRYYIQAAQQIKGTPFTLMKLNYPGVVDHVTYLKENLSRGAKVAIEATCTTVATKAQLEQALNPKGIEVVEVTDWFDLEWKDRPPFPFSLVTRVEDSIAGLSALEKISLIREHLAKLGATHTVVSSLDDIAWTLNLRGADVPYNRIFLSYLVISKEKTLLYSNLERFDTELRTFLETFVELKPYDQFFEDLPTHFNEESVLYFSSEKSSSKTLSQLPSNVDLIEGRDISTLLKAKKNSEELEGMREAHLYDGVAMVRLLASLEREEKPLTELSLAAKLESFRADNTEYLGPSFGTIAGFGEHGALAHYSANEDSSVPLEGNNLLVLDSGGHYATGTTDITRTLLFGEATEEMRRDYTLVLQGNLALAAQIFPQGTNGYQLDVLARQHLWQYGFNYGHGTGHGVGFCLNVHEGPQNISQRAIEVPLEEGMIISDEPGIYREGEYGIRIENLIVVQQEMKTEFGKFFSFEVLTLCPFERELIESDMLSDLEIEMVDNYHKWVYLELSDYLNEDEKEWLYKATRPLL